MLQPRDRLALARWQGARLTGLVSAGAKGGSRVWEIDGLYLPTRTLTSGNDQAYHPYATDVHDDVDGGSADSLALLEELFQAAGERSAERIFMRLGADCPTNSLAKRGGFIAGFNETLLVGEGKANVAASASRPSGAEPLEPMRPRTPADDYGLFQLYCASTPVRVRQLMGLTFDQWRDARETDRSRITGGRQQEWVSEHSDRIMGWVKVKSSGNANTAEVMAHPDHPETLFRMLDFALARVARLRWLVPDYQEGVAEGLRSRGFRQVAQYIMLVKPIAVPALSYGMAPVEA